MEPVSSYSNVYISGTLRDVNGDLISKKKVNVYQGQEEQLGIFKTNSDGSFRVSIPNNSKACQIELLFRLINEKKHCDPDTKVTLIKVRHEKEEVVIPLKINANEVFLDEIQMETAFDDEKVPLSYTLDIAKSAVTSLLRGTGVDIKTKLFGMDREKSIESIQMSYDVNPIPLTDKNIYRLLTNGICPIYPKKEEDGMVSTGFNWNPYSMDKISLPNTKAYWSGWESHNPKIEKIEVQYRKGLNPPKSWKDMELQTVHYPLDHDFETIKRKFNNGALVFGQTVYHLGWGHVYGARIAQLSYDHLQGTKLGELILPHCKFIRKITNDLGKTAIMGKGGILDRSPLSTDGILQALARTIGALNPFTSRPRKAINDKHVFAQDSQVFYEALDSAVSNFIDDNWEEISTTDWQKVNKFFYKVHAGSPFFQQWESENADMNEWLDNREIGGVPNPRVPERTKSNPSDEEVRSIPLVAYDLRGPKEHDKEMIRLFIVDFIHRVTYWHSAVHRTQYTDSPNFPHSKDVNFTPICLEGDGEAEFGGILKEDVIQQQEVGRIFQNFPVKNYALTNEDSGVNPKIVAAIAGIASKLSIPLSEVTTSTVI